MQIHQTFQFYIGPDATIVDPDPLDPDKEPEIDEEDTMFSVTVSTKVIWAAFASAGGEVTAPTYTIENKSNFAIDVAVSSFGATRTDNEQVDDLLTLNLLGEKNENIQLSGVISEEAWTMISAKGNYTISLGGEYTGRFAQVVQPSYDLTLKFSMQ